MGVKSVLLQGFLVTKPTGSIETSRQQYILIYLLSYLISTLNYFCSMQQSFSPTGNNFTVILGWFFRLLFTFYFPEDKLEKPEKPVNGEDKGDSGVDTQNSEGNADEEDPLGPNCYYDKTKSFFDNISCDDNRYGLQGEACQSA